MQTSSVDQLISHGIDLAAQDRYLEAVQHFAKALELDAQNKAAYTQLGLVYKDMGDAEGAVQFWQRAASLDENDAFVRINLGLTFFQAGILPEAKAYLGQAIDLMNIGLDAARQQATTADMVTRAKLLTQCDEVQETLTEICELVEHIEAREQQQSQAA